MHVVALTGIISGIVMMTIGLRRVPLENVAIDASGLRVTW
jgi:hypothetical protein